MTTYYVDATSGDDTKAGTSEATAWKTIGKVNGETFNAGDFVLFKRGETWTGTCLEIPSSGSASGYITFGAYGAVSGARPIIDGNDTVNCVYASGKSYLKFRNLDCTQGKDSGFQFYTCAYVDVIDCDAHDAGNDNLIFIDSCHDCTVARGKFYDGYQRTPTTVVSGIEIADGSYNITIDGAECYGQIDGGYGITIHSHAATTMPTGITVKNCICRNNAGYGISVLKQDNADDTGDSITLQNNTVYSNTLDGIRVWKSVGATDYASGVTVRGNHSRDNTQFAYYIQCKNSTVYQNVFQGRGYIVDGQTVTFYNNTLYLSGSPATFPLYIQGATSASVAVKNNVIYVVDALTYVIGINANATGAVDIDYNLYYLANEAVTNNRWQWGVNAYNWANWLANSGQDANSPAADQDPLFVNAAGNVFALKRGSPAMNVGVDVGLTYAGTAPDCGAYEVWDAPASHTSTKATRSSQHTQPAASRQYTRPA